MNQAAPAAASAQTKRSALADRLDTACAALTPPERLALLRREVAGRIVFCTSFGLEDQAITHMIATAGLAIETATLDTGRLPPETYTVWAETERRYGLRVRPIFPDAASIEAMVGRWGIDGFYSSREARLACCAIRKVAPLSRALDGAAAWVAGLRADQSAQRHGGRFVAVDRERGTLKASPLLDWSRPRVADFAVTSGVPINPLHDKGFPSIGCAPCTRAVRPGEAERAGRWWWEIEETKECGLHMDEHGRLVRKTR